MMTKRLLYLIFSYMNKLKFLFGLILSMVGTGLGLLIPQFIGRLLDSSYLAELLQNQESLLILVVFFIGIYSLQAYSTYLLGSCASQALNILQTKIYSSLLYSSVKELDNYQAGDLASRLTNDMSIVLNFITVVLPAAFLDSIVILGSVYFLLTIHPLLTLLSGFCIPILLLVMVPLNKKLEENYARYQEKIGDISAQISHKFTNVRLIKSFQGEIVEKQGMASSFSLLSILFRRIVRLSVFQNSLVNSLMMGFVILMMLIAGNEVSKGVLTMGTLTVFILYVTQLLDPVTDLFHSLSEWSEFSSVSARLLVLLELKSEIGEFTNNEYLDGDIVFKDVSFAYEKDSVLKDLTFTIPKGKHVAIVGPSGSGKSTIFNLLLKFYDQYNGDITIAGQDIKELSHKELRSCIAYVSQGNQLFQGSIRDNLLYAKNNNISEVDVHHLLQMLDLREMIDSLPLGLETTITESGVGLSEGQKQRLAIARALLSKSSIYLMDEVTASLDSFSERRVSQVIDRVTANKTRLTIAHRLQTVTNADYVLVLNKNGSLADFGEHKEVLARNVFYKQCLQELASVV